MRVLVERAEKVVGWSLAVYLLNEGVEALEKAAGWEACGGDEVYGLD